MGDTQDPYQASRAERRVLRLGPEFRAPSAATLTLFSRRMRIRTICLWVAIAAYLPLSIGNAWRAMRLPDHPTGTALHAYALLTGASTALIGLVFVILDEVTRIGYRRIADSLPVRVGRPERVGLLTILGRVRAAYLVVVLAGQAAVVVASFVAQVPGLEAYRYGVLIGFAGCATAAVLGLVREVRRPALAVDSMSLAIDERLRSEDAFSATWPLMYLALNSMTALAPVNTGWLALMTFVICTLSNAMWFWAQLAKPWPRPRPAPWVANAVQLAR